MSSLAHLPWAPAHTCATIASVRRRRDSSGRYRSRVPWLALATLPVARDGGWSMEAGYVTDGVLQLASAVALTIADDRVLPERTPRRSGCGGLAGEGVSVDCSAEYASSFKRRARNPRMAAARGDGCADEAR